MTIQAISYGGGVQSTALLVLAARREIPYDVALFANVGDDSEHPDSIRYVRDVARPYAEAHGIRIHELKKTVRNETVTLREYLTDPDRRSVTIPSYMSGGVPTGRACTVDFKIRVIQKWLRQNGATKDDPAVTAIGISVDEIERANKNKDLPKYQRIEYPLLDLGLHRHNCKTVIADAGLEVPPKSSCYFCPYHRPSVWAEMRRDEPELFALSADLESLMNQKRARNGQEAVYLTKYGKPITEAINEAQITLFDTSGPDSCDSGYCWT
jgi:hypothetical protein